MKWITKNWLVLLLIFVALIALNKQCEKPKERIKTVTKIERVTDTVIKTVISKPQTVYVERTKTIKGKDSIIYRESATYSTIIAKIYNTKLESNSATADLQITTTGELLDVQGTINYPKITETTTITKTTAKSGLFIYGDLPITQNFNPELGFMYQFKNTALIKVGGQYNNFTKSIDVNVGVGFRIF